jgi:hypothetical protein
VKEPIETFKLTQDHIKLLQAAYIDWYDCEYGAPGIDCKRPYGSSGEEIIKDVRKILGRKLSETQVRKIHEELEIALQIVLYTLSFKPGTYIREFPFRNWELV